MTEADPLLYRWGFLIESDPAARPPAPPEAGWSSERIGALTVMRHPRTPLREIVAKGGSAILIGLCFGIGTTVDDAVARMLASPDDASPLDDLSGRFCLVLVTQGRTHVYNDAFGAQTLFYSTAHPGAVASHAELLADHVGAAPSAQVDLLRGSDVYKTLSVKYLPGHLTVFEGVLGLIPNHLLRLKAGKPRRYWPRAPLEATGFEQFAERFETSMRALSDALSDREIHVGVTGGIDTRLLMAGLSRGGARLRGMTWLGNFHDPSERVVIDEILKRFPMTHGDIPIPGPRDEIARVSGRNAGRHRGTSRLTSAIADSLPCGPRDVFLRGYGGEIIRGFYNLMKKPMTSFDPSEQVRLYLHKSSRPDAASGEVLDVVRQAFESFSEAAGYGAFARTFDHDPNDIFYWEQRMGMWAAGMLNEMDAAMYSLTGLNDRRLYEIAMGMPRAERLTKDLFKRLVDRFEPRLAGLPVV